jgi:hypothetical protein
MGEPNVSTDEALIGDLESPLIALELHPMFTRESFKILRYNLLHMKSDGLTPNILELKARFVAMPDAELLPVWFALHNPWRFEDRNLH